MKTFRLYAGDRHCDITMELLQDLKAITSLDAYEEVCKLVRTECFLPKHYKDSNGFEKYSQFIRTVCVTGIAEKVEHELYFGLFNSFLDDLMSRNLLDITIYMDANKTIPLEKGKLI